MRINTPNHYLPLIACVTGCFLWSSAVKSWNGSRNLETGLDEESIIFFEDFEALGYEQHWNVFWGRAPGAGTVEKSSGYVFSGDRSAYLQAERKQHKSRGAGEYIPDTAIDDVAHVRVYLRLEDGFDMGLANQLKLFGIRGGAGVQQTYGGAGKRPTGTDKFSTVISLDHRHELHLYTYHSDQRGGFGEWFYCNSFFCSEKLQPGRWYCIETMLKNNTPEHEDGELVVWKDNKLVIHIKKLRFRDDESVKIRRFTVINYFGGGGQRNTSPKAQRLYLDNYVISRERIGCEPSSPK